MSRIKQLIQSYSQFVAIPWRNVAPAQRVIFCVYHEAEERALRTKIEEFELVTRQAGHDWKHIDLTDTFAEWMSSQRYAKSYFEKPELLPTLLHRYLDYVCHVIEQSIDEKKAGENTVVSISGVGSLFGFIKVRDVVDRVAPSVKGRLLILYPGSYEDNNYYLLSGHDGWNYLAVPITSDQ